MGKMSGNFWRGLIAGSLLAAVVTMLKNPQRKAAKSRETNLINRMRQPRRSANRMLREVSRTMDGWVRKRR